VWLAMKTGVKRPIMRVGTRAFSYNAAYQLVSEAIDGSSGGLYSKIITRAYQNSNGVPGRYAGVAISADSYSVTYSYDAYGRSGSMTAGADTFTYAYLANSDLPASISYPSTISSTRTYDDIQLRPPATPADYVGQDGNITAYVDSSDDVVYSADYSPFGEAFSESGTAPCAFGFSTTDRDEETGFLIYRFRPYDPNTIRWPSPDPIGEFAYKETYVDSVINHNDIQILYSQAITMSYVYLSNNSIGEVDIFGLAWYDYVPVVAPTVALLTKHEGEQVDDYAHLSVNPSQCKAAPDDASRGILEEECCKSVEDYGWTNFVTALGLKPERGVADVALSGIGSAGATWADKGLFKASAEVVAKKALVKEVSIGLAGIGAFDIVLTTASLMKLGGNYYDAVSEAKKNYCDCCSIMDRGK